MNSYQVNEIEVNLPWPRWPAQEALMEKCIGCITRREVGLLESAAGSGKTLALLCASLGWLQNTQKKLITSNIDDPCKKIIYASHSNQELQHVVKEFKETSYYFNTSMEVMPDSCDSMQITTGSGDQQQENQPSLLLTTHECIIREPGRASFKNAVLILDDGHEIEEKCKHSASTSINTCAVESCIERLRKELQDNTSKPELSEHLLRVKNKFENLRNAIWTILPHYGLTSSQFYSGGDILKFFRHSKLEDYDLENIRNSASFSVISEVARFLSHVHRFPENALSSFRVYSTSYDSETMHDPDCRIDSKPCKTLHFLCLDPAVIMSKVLEEMKPYSLIVTSAILSPLLVLMKELSIPTAMNFVNGHFLEDHQIYARIVTCGVGGYYLDSSCSTQGTRFDTDYLTSLGKSILEIVKVTPKDQGVLVYFSSRKLLNDCLSHWQVQIKYQSLWDSISQHKKIFTRPEDIVTPTSMGSCFLAVLHGKELEYVKLEINHRRVVVIIGFPSLPENDPKIQLKMKFNDENTKKTPGREFLRRECYQVVKRVVDYHIRSTSEYGVVLLLDCRFTVNQLSPYMMEFFERQRRFPELLQELEDFFKFVKTRIQANFSMSQNTGSIEIAQTSSYTVQGYEFEKLRLEVTKVQKKNKQIEMKVQQLKEDLIAKGDTENELKTMIQELKEALKEKQKPDLNCVQVEEERNHPELPGTSESKTNLGLPLKCGVSPRKRPFSE